MSADVNHVVLIGRLTRDAEMRYTASGQAICNLSLAVNRRIKKDDQWIEEGNFFDLTLWGKSAEALQRYLLKGTQVAVDGELRQDRWEKEGQKFSKVTVNVNNLQLLGSRQGSGGEPRSASPEPRAAEPRSNEPRSGESRGRTETPPPSYDPQSYEDDIPF